MTDPRLNRRAPRGRDGRARRRYASYAEHGLDVWAAWVKDAQELGWPRESSEVRAFYAAQTASVAPGRDNSVRQGVGIPLCKETRSRRVDWPVRIDRAQLGPRVHRLLLDMDEQGMGKQAQILRACWLFPRVPMVGLAEDLKILTFEGKPAMSTFFRLKRHGLAHLEMALSWQPRR